MTLLGSSFGVKVKGPYISLEQALSQNKTDFHNTIIPMVAWAATLIAMKGYTLTGAKMKEIQAVNACRRDAVAKGMKLEEAMNKWQTMEQLPAEYRS